MSDPRDRAKSAAIPSTIRGFFLPLALAAFCAMVIGGAGRPAVAGPAAAVKTAPKPESVLVEVFLAKGHKKESKAIKKEFASASIRKVRFQYFRAGNPPANIAIGPEIPAPIARLAIRLAKQYAQGIDFIVPESLLPVTWIGIGTSAFDEKNLIPITPENVERLADPKLSSEEFHALYNEFARPPKLY